MIEIIVRDIALYSENVFRETGGDLATAIEFGVGMSAPFPSLIGDFKTINIVNNQFEGISLKVMGGYGFNGTGLLKIQDNLFSNCGIDNPPGLVFLRIQPGANIGVDISSNTWADSQDLSEPSVYIETTDATSNICLTLKENTSDATPESYVLDNSGGGAANFTADVSGNSGNVVELGTINAGSCP